MTTDNMNTPLAIEESAIRQAADKIIATTCAKHGITADQLPPGAIEDAHRVATEMFESEQRNQANPSHQLYLQAKKENDLLKAQLSAVRENRTAKADTRTIDSMERVRDLMGRDVWFQLSRDQKVASLGVEPSSVDVTQLRRLFGRGSDGAYAVDFQKTNPYRYRQLREVAKCLDVTGK